MRIIGGKHKGRRLSAPSNIPVRPTTDQAKEALFNILRNHYDMEGLRVLDLFAGIGSLSFEFASRDAGEVHSVELNPRCAGFISETTRKLGLENLFVIRANAFSYIRKSHKKFDIIFADPPYDLEGIESIPDQVFDHELLDAEGWLIIEHGKEISFEGHPNLDQHRRYGRVNFSMFSVK